MAKKRTGGALQGYPREKDGLLAREDLFPKRSPPLDENELVRAIKSAFTRCMKKKSGATKNIFSSPEKLVDLCVKHLKERSDPILSPSFVSQIEAEDLFELDAVSHEMQRHRMSMGVFYQFLILELMRYRWPVFDGSREGDIVADIDTPSFDPGLRLYMSVKKSKDTVGGQDIGDAIKRLENQAKGEKNLTRPYLCVLCVATPAKGKLTDYSDRNVKRNSLNCEYWGPGFIFPYVTGHEPFFVYAKAYQQVADYLPFMTLRFRKECTGLLKEKLRSLGLLNSSGKIDPEKFVAFLGKSNA